MAGVEAVMKGAGRGSLLKIIIQVVERLTKDLPPELRRALTTTLYLTVPMSIVGTVGGVAYSLYGTVINRFRVLLRRYLQVSMVYHNRDKHYDAVLDYIGARCHVETGVLEASTTPRVRPGFAEMLAQWLGGKTASPTLYYQPDLQRESAVCFHWKDPEGKQHKIHIQRHVKEPQLRSDSGNKAKDPETIVMTLWWSTDPKPLKDFMGEALRTMLSEDSEGRVDIYVKHMWLPIWTKAISKERRDRDTVVLDEHLAENVLDDMRHFFTKSTADWYHNAGIPYRRGYLLYGPPGCGKTSFAQVLAGELGLDVCLMNLSNSEMNDDDLAELLRNAPPRSMLLLEDVDAIFVERTAAKDKSQRGGGISFSGLLNALDGAAAQEGCVITLTTNHKDRLDEALIRPGRCDVHVHITKASQEQAKRMFYRFFAQEVPVKSAESGKITMGKAHGLATGDAVMYKAPETSQKDQGKPGSRGLLCAGAPLPDKRVLYARVPSGPAASQTQLALYESSAAAHAGGPDGLLKVEGGKGGRLQHLPEIAERFSSRIPERQVSMAKLQGYLMKQKLLAEQNFTGMRDRNTLPALFSGVDPLSSEFQFLYEQEIRSFASESAIMNVHELLDVKVEAEDTAVQVPIFDHFRRVGLHHLAAIFEHFGVHFRRNLSEDLLGRMESWHPDLKMDSPQKDRLKALIKGDSKLDAAYNLADLSVLRDRFLAAYQGCDGADAWQPPASDKLLLPLAESLSGAPAPPPMKVLYRASSAPVSLTGADDGEPLVPPSPLRRSLLRQTSKSGQDEKLTLLDMAHQFQERLEKNGKTEVSMWQLDMHFQRFAGDPVGAVKNCSKLIHHSADRSSEERAVPWLTTFAVLRRLGLEKYAFKLEDAGYSGWTELKVLSKDDLKDKGEMSEADASLCHAVLSCSGDRPELLRRFQVPEFKDLLHMFHLRFPAAAAGLGQGFAQRLTDELGVSEFSFHQVQRYLDEAEGPTEAVAELRTKLPPLDEAQANRVRPEAPPPPKEPDDWLYTWLKAESLEGSYGAFMGQALLTREDLLAAPLDHEALGKMGVQKMGERCKLLRMVEAEKQK